MVIGDIGGSGFGGTGREWEFIRIEVGQGFRKSIPGGVYWCAKEGDEM
jgi:hypothetical protein